MTIGELLIGSIASWPTFLLIVAVFGFFPGFTLRILVLGYRKEDPRRKELVAELYVLPYWKRPLWVAEQLETVAFDGVWPRVHFTLEGRLFHRWSLGSGVRMNRKHPDTFEIPTDEDKAAIKPGALVKLMFQHHDGEWIERMWVCVTKVGRFRMEGELFNEPFDYFAHLESGSKVKFRAKHVIGIVYEDDSELVDTFEVVPAESTVATQNPFVPPIPAQPELPPADAA